MTSIHICDTYTEILTETLCKCGDCGQTFPTICQLHNHFLHHDSKGSYYYDSILRIAFAKFGTACKSTQTEDWSSEETDITKKKRLHIDQLQERTELEPLLGQKAGAKNIKRKKHLTSKNRKSNVKQKQDVTSDNKSKSGSGPPSSLKEKMYHNSYLDATTGFISDISQNIKTVNDTSQFSKSNTHIEKSTKTISLVEGVIRKETDEEVANEALTETVDKNKLFNEQNVDRTMRCEVNEDRDTNCTSKNEGQFMREKDSFCNNDSNIEMIDPGPDPEMLRKIHCEQKLANSIVSSLSHHSLVHSHAENFVSENCKNIKKSGDKIKVFKTWTPVRDNADLIPERSDAFGSATNTPVRSDLLNISQTHKGKSEIVKHIVDAQLVTQTVDAEKITQLVKKKKQECMAACEICGKNLRKSSYQGHLNAHYGRSPFVCEICGLSYASKKSLGMHKICRHPDENLMKQCKFCDKKFPTNARLTEHTMSHTKDQEFVCTDCGRIFFSKNILKSHRKYVHDPITEYFQCSKCDKKFKSNKTFKEHYRSHTETFICSVCEQTFNRQSSLLRHMKMHSRDKPHICHICGHTFIQKTPYWVHMEKHHDLTKSQLKESFPQQHGNMNCTVKVSQ